MARLLERDASPREHVLRGNESNGVCEVHVFLRRQQLSKTLHILLLRITSKSTRAHARHVQIIFTCICNSICTLAYVATRPRAATPIAAESHRVFGVRLIGRSRSCVCASADFQGFIFWGLRDGRSHLGP
jgi:hypothetical protein